VKPAAAVLDDKAGTGAPVTLGAIVDVRKGDKHWISRPGRNYYPARDGSEGVVGRYFNGEANSEVAVKWGALGNFWIAAQPDISTLQPAIAEGNRRFAKLSSPDVLAVVLAVVARRYVTHEPPITFTAIHSPMIMWIWVGGLIVIVGSLTALWPSPEARRRRASSLAAARLGRELSRA
jgi:cytochrome c-type biogenesis protein CcmF